MPIKLFLVHDYDLKIAVNTNTHRRVYEGGKTPGGYPRDVWVELCRRGIQAVPLFKTKIGSFPYPVKDKKFHFMNLGHFV